MISIERLKEVLNYDPETGVFSWRITLSQRAQYGKEAGHLSARGYIDIRVDRVLYRAHRLAWLWVTGTDIKHEIDHINGRRSDNKFCNLRDVKRLINGQNHRKPDRDSRTGFLGVTRNGRKYCAQIGANGKNHYLGLFNTPEGAHAAYVQAKRRLHPGGTL